MSRILVGQPKKFHCWNFLSELFAIEKISVQYHTVFSVIRIIIDWIVCRQGFSMFCLSTFNTSLHTCTCIFYMYQYTDLAVIFHRTALCYVFGCSGKWKTKCDGYCKCTARVFTAVQAISWSKIERVLHVRYTATIGERGTGVWLQLFLAANIIFFNLPKGNYISIWGRWTVTHLTYWNVFVRRRALCVVR